MTKLQRIVAILEGWQDRLLRWEARRGPQVSPEEWKQLMEEHIREHQRQIEAERKESKP